ncbi:NADH-ubiquinone oxidoreductase subunit [Arthroderma uncinatum]|uniref:NADH-ubiquinone oxidoreductase subunit n=1 Tax=Arthroderma uncinatum TaxID=74035 RepID=UPI00144A738B|nr:NADH-ubiquinone oxidoreductase subunit [Arthroderma uncinatum]KAF3481012.1 NADH-ubiquinone oxidoreductase subunit [Arthroderma uncinatum]
MAADHGRPIVPSKHLNTDYPSTRSYWTQTRKKPQHPLPSTTLAVTYLSVTFFLNDMKYSHIRRVFGYARTSDYLLGAGVAAVSPLVFGVMDRVQPAASAAINFARCMRLSGAVGLAAGVLTVYQRSSNRFYGLTENAREEEMDMREMVEKVKKGEPLYGVSSLSPYMQGVAARNSRYTSLFIHVIPWFNVVNHNQHGVDTAKYYRQAERELEAERVKMMTSQ